MRASAPQAVDSLTIEVIVDNRTDSLSSTPNFVQSEFSKVLGRPRGKLAGSCLCCAGHGLSLLITAMAGSATATVLFDTGPDAALFVRNVDVLGIDLSKVGDIVLSHGHWDHAAGLQEALSRTKLSRNGGCPLHVNEGMFVRRGVRMSGGRVLPFEDIPGIAALESSGARPVLDGSARLIANDLFFLSGEIARTTPFETGYAGHVSFDSSTNSWIDDPLIMDERYLAVYLRERGWFVFSACSHAGAVNVVRDLCTRFPGQSVFGLMGGLHLSGALMEAKIKKTVEMLAEAGLELVVPAHCSGWRAVSALTARFGESAVVPCAVGQTLRI